MKITLYGYDGNSKNRESLQNLYVEEAACLSKRKPMTQSIISLTVLAAFNVCAESTVTNSVIAHLQGSSWGSKVDTNVVVTAKKQTVFHFHADGVDEGWWYDVTIVNDGGRVTVLERDSATSRSGCGSKVETSESLYRFPLEKMNIQVVELSNDNRITLKNNGYKPLPIKKDLNPQEIWERCFPIEVVLYPGETPESKAKEYGVAERDIRIVNGLGPNEVPVVGMTIRIPIPIDRNGVIKPSDKQIDPADQAGSGIARNQPAPISEHALNDFDPKPYSYFPTNLSHGYSLSYRVYRELSDAHLIQSLTLVRGNQDIKELSGMSYGLLHKNLGYIGADFEDTFLFVQSWGGGNPHDIQLIEKATGAIITEGTWVSVNEEEGLFLYLHDIFESTAELRLYDTCNKKETVIDVREPVINLRTVWDSWSEISVSNSPFSDEYILDYCREGEAFRKRYDK